MVDPNEILSRMKTRYQRCRSYSDSGVIRNLGESDIRKKFKTYFVRPNKFRFEWTSYHPYFGKKGELQHYMIWSDGRDTFVRYHFNEYLIKKVGSLSDAVASATGISSGTVHTIYRLLLPNALKRSSSLLNLKEASMAPSGSVLGESCIHVKGLRPIFTETAAMDAQLTELWISRNDYGLRKLKSYNLITTAILDEALKQSGRELHRRERRADRAYVSECKYSSVSFDIEIESAVFSPTFL